MIKTIYNTPLAQVLVNGYLTRPMTLKCGVRQGCPLSCALFIMCIEPLGCSIRTHKRLQGIKIKGTKKRINGSYFADDSSITITKQKQIPILRGECIGTYEKGSGAKLNDGKTVLIPIGESNTRLMVETEMKMKPRYKADNFLGDIIGNKVNNEIFKKPIKRTKKKIQTWGAINTTVYGREVIKKQQIYPQIAYRASTNVVNKQTMATIEKLTKNYLWPNPKTSLKKSVATLPKNLAGIKEMDMETQINAGRIWWIKNYHTTNSAWKYPFKQQLEDLKNKWGIKGCIFSCTPTKKMIKNLDTTNFAETCMKTWYDIQGGDLNTVKHTRKDIRRIKETNIWGNPEIQIKWNADLVKKGICQIKDLLDNESFMTPKQLKTKKITKRNYNIIIEALPIDYVTPFKNYRKTKPKKKIKLKKRLGIMWNNKRTPLKNITTEMAYRILIEETNETERIQRMKNSNKYNITKSNLIMTTDCVRAQTKEHILRIRNNKLTLGNQAKHFIKDLSPICKICGQGIESKQHYQEECPQAKKLKEKLKRILTGYYIPENEDEWKLLCEKGKKQTTTFQTHLVIAEAHTARWNERTKASIQQEYKYNEETIWNEWEKNMKNTLQVMQETKNDPKFNKTWEGIATWRNKKIFITTKAHLCSNNNTENHKNPIT